MSVLGFTSPAVTPTNLVFNVVGLPSAVWRYFREGRMNWPLAWNIIVGTFPGLFLVMIIRIVYLPDPGPFKLFAGCVLLYIGARMLYQIVGQRGLETAAEAAEAKMRQQSSTEKYEEALNPNRPAMRTMSWSLSRTEYEFFGECFGFHTTGLFMLSLVLGLVGGIYGIGGGLS